VDRVLSNAHPTRWIIFTLTGGSLALLALGLAWLMPSNFARATSYGGDSTGYAFANATGAGGYAMSQGMFANHSSYYCPSDPASYWSWGTNITSFSPGAAMYDSGGYETVYTGFTLRDIGDSACDRSDYWTDLYFGRFKPNSDQCDCHNPADVCDVGVVNSCTIATDWGLVSATYNK
jgi:hypothetical protein